MKVRLYSPIGRVTGYGRAGVELAQTLLRVPGVDLEISASANPGEATQPVPDAVAACIRPERDLSYPDVIIVHTLPLDCGRLADRLGVQMDFGPGWATRKTLRPKLVAYTTWETLAPPPNLLEGLFPFDQIWIPSRANYDALSYETLENKLRVVPHAFDEARWETLFVKAPLSTVPRPYRFYYVGAWTARKNPAGLIRAFCYTFKKGDPVELFLHLGPAPGQNVALAIGSTGIDASQQPTMRVGMKYITDEAMRELHNSHDCFVTATRGEAWNLPAFDALLAGNHVIAPRGQGSDDFLQNTSAGLYAARAEIAQVDARLIARTDNSFGVEVTSPQGVDGKSVWLEPDLLELSRQMAHAVKNQVYGIRGPDPRHLFGYDAVARLVTANLKELVSP